MRANSTVHDVVAEAIEALPACERSEWAEIHQAINNDPLELLSSWTETHRRAVRVAIATWIMAQTDPEDALRQVLQWSARLGVAMACVVARDALYRSSYGSAITHLPTVEAAEGWVHGLASMEFCKSMGEASYFSEQLGAAESEQDVASGVAYLVGYRLQSGAMNFAFGDYVIRNARSILRLRNGYKSPSENNAQICSLVGNSLLTGQLADLMA